MPSELTIIYEQGATGVWIASIAEVPGAFSQGQTREEARTNVLDALAELMAARRQLALQNKGPDADTESVPLTASAR